MSERPERVTLDTPTGEPRLPWVNENGSTNVDGFRDAYRYDDNTFWRAEQGHIQNVLDATLELLDDMTEDRAVLAAGTKRAESLLAKTRAERDTANERLREMVEEIYPRLQEAIAAMNGEPLAIPNEKFWAMELVDWQRKRAESELRETREALDKAVAHLAQALDECEQLEVLDEARAFLARLPTEEEK